MLQGLLQTIFDSIIDRMKGSRPHFQLRTHVSTGMFYIDFGNKFMYNYIIYRSINLR